MSAIHDHPFDAWNLAASSAEDEDPQVVRFDGFVLDRGRGQLMCGGAAVPLRPKAFELLSYFAERPGKVVSKDKLLRAIWPRLVVTPDSLTQCISELRAALHDLDRKLIKTVSRRGYLFDPQPRTAPNGSAQPIAPGSPASQPIWTRRSLHDGAPLCIDSILSERRSIAVLPFTDLSDEKRGYFIEGVAEDLTAALARVPHTLVVARESAAAAAHVDPDPRRIGQALKVRYVLSGSLRRSNTALTIVATLVNTQDGTALWTEHFDYATLADWTWQRDIAQRIAGELPTRLSLIEGSALSRAKAMDAIDAVMRGRATENRSNQPSVALEARAHYEAALKVDPRSVSALTGLGHSYADQVNARWSSDRLGDMARAETYIARAFEIDPNHGPAHLARGHLRYAQGDHDGALSSFQQVIALNPSDAYAYALIALMMYTLGRPTEVYAHADLAIRLDPLSIRTVSLAHQFAASADFTLERDDAAYARCRAAVSVDPTLHSAYLWMAAIDGLHDRLDAARENLAMFQRRRPLIKTLADLEASQPPRSAVIHRPYRAKTSERRRAGLLKAGMPEGEPPQPQPREGSAGLPATAA